MFCRSLFVLLYFFFWPLCCLFFFDIRILITPLVSSNSSYNCLLFDVLLLLSICVAVILFINLNVDVMCCVLFVFIMLWFFLLVLVLSCLLCCFTFVSLFCGFAFFSVFPVFIDDYTVFTRTFSFPFIISWNVNNTGFVI